MRRILVERARRTGGSSTAAGAGGSSLDDVPGDQRTPRPAGPERRPDPAGRRGPAQAAELVELHYFAGLTVERGGRALGISVTAARRLGVRPGLAADALGRMIDSPAAIAVGT